MAALRSTDNTPQAVDDTAFAFEDGALLIDVMINDRAGQAKVLYGVAGPDPAAPASLGVSRYGALVTIEAGKIRYDASASAAIDALADGEQVQDSFLYAIQMANGTWSWASVEVTVSGSNDAASISGSASGALAEDAAGTVAGTLRVVDVDLGENAFGAVGPLAGRYGSFRFDAGDWSYALDPALTQALGAGEPVRDTLSVSSLDGSATQEIVVTITGENDAPTVLAEGSIVAGEIDELPDRSPDENSAVHAARGTIAFTDVDRGDSLSASVGAAPAGYLGTLSLAPLEGQEGAVSWVFTVDDQALDALAAGEERVQTYDVQIADAHGGAVTQQVSVTLRGADDAAMQSAPDVFVAASGTQDFALLDLRDTSGDGVIDDGTLLPVPAPGFYGTLAAADFDGDGRIDVARSDNSDGQGVRLFLNRDANADGVPELVPLLLAGGTTLWEASGVAAGDVNGDGRADLFLGTGVQDFLYLGIGDTNGDALPEFRRMELPRLNNYSYGIGIGDLDGDGRADLISASWGDRTYIAINRGDGNGDGLPEFTYQSRGPGTGTGMGQLTLADVNGDGRTDILAPTWFSAPDHALFMNRGDRNGDGQLDFDRVGLPSGEGALDGALADIDRDGDLDAFIFETNQTRIFTNAGDGNGDGLPEFLAAVIVPGQTALGGSAGDMDGDGDADFVRANHFGGLDLATNRGDLDGDGVVEWSVELVGLVPATDALLLDL
jgi:VCBS repeat-containing protein